MSTCHTGKMTEYDINSTFRDYFHYFMPFRTSMAEVIFVKIPPNNQGGFHQTLREFRQILEDSRQTCSGFYQAQFGDHLKVLHDHM
ncbi:hypothetical protein [Neobacillus jeddahensis]|uniref:hypothetical protein n=1 Tax=Neobacillus jeddahensis TaxID=1461580 RepID=UPI00058CB188|nr:hypothetical protein [Neobacillus jeddahensis]